ncbi:hypothetical protein FRC04_001500 [Tulasnella sp. 424]|nr:hypothetical protein FRC04_001500 [Tulasnella sp. 424]
MQEIHDHGGLTALSNFLPNPLHLGKIADFWQRYDNVADRHDRKMSQLLNDNLDVLLIFSGLFSAINTAFISITMPALSPDPTTETNTLLRLLVSGAGNDTLAHSTISQSFTPEPISVVINCLLYASLSCTLLAAMAALICKEWLHRFDRAVPTGSFEEQGRLRQRKFDGAQQWQLEAIIDFLPNIVLFSVTLFFVGLGVYLLTVNTTVAAIVGAFTGFGAIIIWVSILASTVFPLCPYETVTSRVLRRAARVLTACWRRVRRVVRRAARNQAVKSILQLPRIVYIFSRETVQRGLPRTELEDEPPYGNQGNGQETVDSIKSENDAEDYKKQYEQVTNSQAALRLLEVAFQREDQLIAVQFLPTISREACAAVIVSSQRRQLIVSLTLEAFDIWRSQPNEKTQEMAEHFGRALCHVLPNTRGSPEHWKELTTLTQGPRPTFGRRFLKELDSFEHTSELFDTIGEEYSLQLALLRTLILTKDIPIDSFRWTKLRLLIKTKDDDSQLLGLWSILMHKRFGRLRQSVKKEVTDNDFPLALACGVQALKSVERQATADNRSAMLLDAVGIYNSCIHRTTWLAGKNRVPPQFRELVAEAMTDMMAYFEGSVFLDPTERQMVDFFISALQLLQSVSSAGDKPILDDSAFKGLWYTLDSVIVAIGSSTEIDRGSAEDLVLKTFESIIEWLPANSGMYSPMVGLENHPRAIGWIATRFLDEMKQTEGRLVQLMYKNRFHWFTQAPTALRAAWMDAGLSSHLIVGLRRPDAWKNTGQLVRIFEDITETSPEWCWRLVDDGFLASIADAILHFDELEHGTTVPKWSYIQCRLLSVLLSVWRHSSAIPNIRWPTEKMLLVVNRTSPVIVQLLERDATQLDPAAQVSSTVMLGRKAIFDIRDNLIPFFNWIEEHTSTPISRDRVNLAIRRLYSPISILTSEDPLTSGPKAPWRCSRDIYVDDGLL